MLSILFLKIGLGITFILTGLLILSSKDRWVHMLPAWFASRLSSARGFMLVTSIADIILGAWLLSGFFTAVAATLAAVHLLGVLIISGRHEFHEVYRDIGLLFAAVALVFSV